jgi:hypothetical protein
MHAADLTPDWIASRLVQAGQLPEGASIDSIDVRPIGTGQVADSYQVELLPRGTTIVAKLSSDAEQSRAAGRSELNYLREVRFYQEIAPRLNARVPDCHHAEIDSNHTEFALLLEDLSPVRPGNQLEGCTIAETKLALRQAAGFHAPFWGGAELAGSPWLDISGSYWPRFEAMMPDWFAGFRDRYRERMSAADLALGAEFVARVPDYYDRLRQMPFTIQHGDFRPDNVLFDVHGVEGTIAVVDWQTVILGPGAVDVAYFVGGALDVESRREHEESLLRDYHDELQRLGVVTYSWETLLDDYAVGTFHNFVIGVAAAMLVERSDRGDDLFTSMVANALAHARDRGGLEQLRQAVVSHG